MNEPTKQSLLPFAAELTDGEGEAPLTGLFTLRPRGVPNTPDDGTGTSRADFPP